MRLIKRIGCTMGIPKRTTIVKTFATMVYFTVELRLFLYFFFQILMNVSRSRVMLTLFAATVWDHTHALVRKVTLVMVRSHVMVCILVNCD